MARREPRDLPYLYLATAVVITFVTIWLGRALTQHPAKPVLKRAIYVFCGVLLGLSVLAALDVRPALGVLYVAGQVYATSISVLFWARLGTVFDVRSSKRVFGPIAASGMAGAVVGGLLMTVPQIPIVMGCFFAVVTLAAARSLLGPDERRAKAAKQHISMKEGLQYATKDRLPRNVAILVLLLAIQTAAVDYVFRVGAAQSFSQDEGQLAALFGVLNAVVGVGAIAFSFGLTRPLLERLGVFVFLSVVPVLCLWSAGASLLLPGLFLPVFILKTIEMMGSLSLNQPGLQLLYAPMRLDLRDAVRAVTDGAIKKMGGAVGGIFLLLVGTSLDVSMLLIAISVMAAVIIVWVRRLRAPYRVALAEKLGETGFNNSPPPVLDASDASTRDRLREMLTDEDPGRVRAAIAVLQRTEGSDLSEQIPVLLAHPDESIRLVGLKIARERPHPEHIALFEQAVLHGTPRTQAAAVRPLVSASEQRAAQILEPILAAPSGQHDLALVCAAIMARQRVAGSVAKDRLERLLLRGRSGHPEERRQVARLMGHLDGLEHAGELIAFLRDPEPSVRRIAVKSAARLKAPQLLDALIGRLHDRDLRRDLVEAISAYGPEAIPALRRWLDDRRQPVPLRAQIPRILRRIGTVGAMDAFAQSNVHDDAFLRFVLVQEGARLHRENPNITFPPKPVEEAAARRLRAYNHYLPLSLDLAAGGPQFALLQRAVMDRLDQNMEACLKFLGMIYDTKALEAAHRGLKGSAFADAVELLDVALAGSELRPQILAALEQRAPTAIPGRATERARDLVEGRDIQLACLSYRTLMRMGEDPPEPREPTQGEVLMADQIVDRLFVLEGVQLFRGLSVDDLTAVAGIVTEGHADPDEIIYPEGESGDSMYIIVSGEVHLLKADEPLFHLEAGDSFGQVSILDGGLRPVTAQAGGEGVEYLFLPRRPFMDLIMDRPEVVSGLFEVLARRLRELVDLPSLTRARAGSDLRRV